MTYHLDRGLFVENGPTLLAERDRRARAAGATHRLLAAAAALPATEGETPTLCVAA